MVVRVSCISERMPSCMRAPPEAEKTISGALRATARSAAITSPSPTAVPIEPPMKPKSSSATTATRPPIGPLATTSASVVPSALACASLSRAS